MAQLPITVPKHIVACMVALAHYHCVPHREPRNTGWLHLNQCEPINPDPNHLSYLLCMNDISCAAEFHADGHEGYHLAVATHAKACHRYQVDRPYGDIHAVECLQGNTSWNFGMLGTRFFYAEHFWKGGVINYTYYRYSRPENEADKNIFFAQCVAHQPEDVV